MGGTAHSIEVEEDRLRKVRKQEGVLLCGGSSCGYDEANSMMLTRGKPEPYPEASRDYADSFCSAPPAFKRGSKNIVTITKSYTNLDDRSKLDGERLMEGDELIIGPTRPFDFDGFGAIPYGWVRSLKRPPEAFEEFNGSAVVIEPETQDLIDHEEKPKEMRILLALPESHVDMQRAKWLSRRPGFTAEARYICHLCRIKECKAIGQVVFEFSYPRGESLWDSLKDGRRLPLKKAQLLLYRLLALVSTATLEPLRLSGFLDPSMVYLDQNYELQAFLPLGCLLCFTGVRANLLKVVQAGREWALAPELKCAVLTQDNRLSDPEMATITDSYAAALLVIRALGQEFFDRNKGLQVEVPELARDLLVKVLHHECEWRLSGEGALNHPWMQQACKEANES